AISKMESSSKENTQFFSKPMILSIDRSSSRTKLSTSKKKRTLCGGIKVQLKPGIIFLGALSFVYFAKTLSGSYLKSTITQIERRFDIPSSLVGLIDGSFEIGWVQPVAILGPILGFLLGSLCAKLYVDIGFIDMAPSFFFLGTIAITHKDPHWVGAWSLGYLIAGMVSNLAANPFWFLSKHLPRPEIQKDSAEQSRFIAEDNKHCCATYQSHFNFFKVAKVCTRSTDFETTCHPSVLISHFFPTNKYPFSFPEFLPSLKSLLGNPVYFLYLCSSIIQFNSLIGMVTYKPKYIEQQFGQSSSKTNFIIGMVKILVAGNEADATLFGV
ncbi:hypothetical protein E2320_004318, partial [Naja naja]